MWDSPLGNLLVSGARGRLPHCGFPCRGFHWGIPPRGNLGNQSPRATCKAYVLCLPFRGLSSGPCPEDPVAQCLVDLGAVAIDSTFLVAARKCKARYYYIARVQGMKAENPNELETCIKKAITLNKTVLIEVPTGETPSPF